MLSGPLANLSPGAVAYLALVITGFFAIAVTLAIVSAWSDRGPVRSGRSVKVAKPVRPEPKQVEDKEAA
jgi:hypothetical protein